MNKIEIDPVNNKYLVYNDKNKNKQESKKKKKGATPKKKKSIKNLKMQIELKNIKNWDELSELVKKLLEADCINGLHKIGSINIRI